jgi:hypothetical protein
MLLFARWHGDEAGLHLRLAVAAQLQPMDMILAAAPQHERVLLYRSA